MMPRLHHPWTWGALRCAQIVLQGSSCQQASACARHVLRAPTLQRMAAPNARRARAGPTPTPRMQAAAQHATRALLAPSRTWLGRPATQRVFCAVLDTTQPRMQARGAARAQGGPSPLGQGGLRRASCARGDRLHRRTQRRRATCAIRYFFMFLIWKASLLLTPIFAGFLLRAAGFHVV